jgi:nucleoside-diphosphate-sugar epimerase
MTDRTKELILVTGASGFIAKHTIYLALQAGYTVRGTVRNDEESEIALQSVKDRSQSHENRFSLVRADLTSDDGCWKEAVKGCSCVLHIASPYPADPPKEGGREVLVPIAREGTLRVLDAAITEPSVKRTVIVSSVVAMAYFPNRPKPVAHIEETDWTDPDWKKLTWAYAISKTKAEQAAWEFVRKHKSESSFVSVNPAMVWGPLFDSIECASSLMCKTFTQFPITPKISYPIVDVRDVAALLVACIDAPDVGGRRLIASADTINFIEVGRYLAESFPAKFAWIIPTVGAPFWFVWLLSFVDPKFSQNLPDMEGSSIEIDSSYVTDLTGVKFRPAKNAIYAMAESLIEKELV